MKFVTGKKISPIKNDDTVATLMAEESTSAPLEHLPEEISFVGDSINLASFKGKSGDVLFIPIKGRPSVILCGLGKTRDVSRETIRNSCAHIIAECQKRKIDTIHCIIPSVSHLPEEDVFSSVAEGLYLSNYSFSRYKSSKESENRVAKAILHGRGDATETIARETEIICRCALECRDMVNESSDRCTPKDFADEAKKISHTHSLRCTVMDEKEIEKAGMGLLASVGRGSPNPPRLVIVRYKGDQKSSKIIALVGKGITFDSGGLNLKPSGNIETMRSDMAGAAACLYTIKAAAELGLKKNIVAVMPLAENMPGGASYRPGDVYRSYNGKTVEIGNTDAEGRLILADALAYTSANLKPDYMIDIATLTGACIISLGEAIAGLMTPHDGLAQLLFDAGEKTGEKIWRLPLAKEYEEDLKSDFADLINVASGRKAGTIMGALFLKNFVSSIPWAHIDIAGPSWFSKKRGYRPKNATGFGVRLFMEFLKNCPQSIE